MEPEAAKILESHLTQVLAYLQREHVTAIVSKDDVVADSDWE